MSRSSLELLNDQPFLRGGGEMGQLIRSIDWYNNPLGEPSGWPVALKGAASMMLKNNLPVLICWGPDFIQLYNDAFRPINGDLKHPQAMGGSARETYGEIWDTIGPMFSQVMAGQTHGFPDFMVRLNRNGTLENCYFDFSYSPIADLEGQILGVLVICMETTDKIRSLQEVKESEEQRQNRDQQLQLMIEMLPASVVVIRGPDLIVEMINKANLAYWKKAADEVVGKPFLEILPDLAEQPFAGQLRQVMATGEIIDVKESPVLFENPDGTVRETFVDYTYQPLTDANGRRTGVLVMSFEITDRVLARKRVEHSEGNLKAMIAQAPVAMCILSGPDHIITVANRLIVELWGKPQAEVMNKPVFEALPDARGQGLEEVMDKVYETGETYHANELPVSLIRHGQPDVVYQNFVYQAYRDAEGVISGIIAITIDVTEQVLARKKIEQSEKELKEIQRRLETELLISKKVQQQKDDFIGMASHELKTPLTSLKAIIQVANLKLSQSDDPFLSAAMDKASNQVRRMTTMINGFLNVSRLESGKIHIDKHPFDLDVLINDVIAEINLTSNTHLLHFKQCQTIQVIADREKILSVVSNFLSNAIKYSPKGKDIEVNCETKDDQVIVSVKDKGMGIRSEDLDKIFERYYRVEATNTQHIAGFGIGLYLSAEIIARHQGKIWVESQFGDGSTFYFSLPMTDQQSLVSVNAASY
jgi:two-component system sensor histidine kinase VicK